MKIPLCPASVVANGCSLKVECEGLTLCVFNLDGRFYVTDDACTHGPGSLSEGAILDDIVECDFHGGAFNIRTGAVEAPPWARPLSRPISESARRKDPGAAQYDGPGRPSRQIQPAPRRARISACAPA